MKRVEHVITVINLQEPMEKGFIVNYVHKASEEEESFRDMERNSMQNSMEIQELRNCDLCARRFQTRKMVLITWQETTWLGIC